MLNRTARLGLRPAGRFSRKLGQFALAALLASPMVLAHSAAQAQDGARIYNQCKACHSLDEGVNRVGPSLAALEGRVAGAVDGFRYSDALKDSGIVWDADTLDATWPIRVQYPRQSYGFPGNPDEGQRAAVIEYLFSQ